MRALFTTDLGNSKKFDHISPKLQELNWLPVKEHLLFRDTVLMYKCINNLAPPYLCNKFSISDQIYMNVTLVTESSSKYRFIIPLYWPENISL
jgi:hypothetical protein